MLHKIKIMGVVCVYLERLETSKRPFNSNYYIEVERMNTSDKMLADLNKAVQRVANDSGSKLVRNLVMVEQVPPNNADHIFRGIIDVWAWFRVTGMAVKVTRSPDRNLLHKLVKVRIQDSLLAIMDLAQSELKKLGREVSVQ